MGRIVRTEDECTFEAPPLRLSFHWDGQKWTHRLAVAVRTVLYSLEWEPGRDDPGWVVSPAYQQLNARESDEGPQALLVGQWGPHHGSAVFTILNEPSGVAVEADVAVRSRTPPETLACTYLVDLTSSDLADAGPSAIVWELSGPTGGQLRFEPWGTSLGSGRVGFSEAGRRATQVQATAEVIPGLATQRLGFRWRWVRDWQRQ